MPRSQSSTFTSRITGYLIKISLGVSLASTSSYFSRWQVGDSPASSWLQLRGSSERTEFKRLRRQSGSSAVGLNELQSTASVFRSILGCYFFPVPLQPAHEPEARGTQAWQSLLKSDPVLPLPLQTWQRPEPLHLPHVAMVFTPRWVLRFWSLGAKSPLQKLL